MSIRFSVSSRGLVVLGGLVCLTMLLPNLSGCGQKGALMLPSAIKVAPNMTPASSTTAASAPAAIRATEAH